MADNSLRNATELPAPGEPPYPEEEGEAVIAALTLCTMRHAKIDESEMLKIEAHKRKDEAIMIRRGAGELPHWVLLELLRWEPPAIPAIPRIRRIIGECSIPFEKQLTKSDTRPDQNRLALNKAYVEKYVIPMMSPDEKRGMEGGVDVTAYDFEGNEYSMKFKIWATKTPVLIKTWNAFATYHGFQAYRDFVSVWTFRHAETGDLCFAITSRRLPVDREIKKSEYPPKEKVKGSRINP